MKGIVALALGLILAGCGGKAAVRGTDPLTPAEHVQLAQSYEMQNLTDEAEREYEAALKKNRDEVAALMGLGNIKFKQGKLGSASNYFDRVLKIQPRHAGAVNNLAMIAVEKDSGLVNAEKNIQRVLFDAGTLRPYLQDTLANIYILQRRYADADRALAEAHHGAPSGDPTFHERLQQTRQKLNDARGLGR